MFKSSYLVYKNKIWGTIEKLLTRAAMFILFSIICYGIYYYLETKKNIDVSVFGPLLIVVGCLLFFKVMINILASRK